MINVKVIATIILIINCVACEAIRDTLPDDVQTLGDIPIETLDDDMLMQVINAISTEISPTVNVSDESFSVCCESIELWKDTQRPILRGKITNNTPFTYKEVIHHVEIRNVEGHQRAVSIISYTDERDSSRDLQPFDSWFYSIVYTDDLKVEDFVNITFELIEATLAD